jgi:hypothetical protein
LSLYDKVDTIDTQYYDDSPLFADLNNLTAGHDCMNIALLSGQSNTQSTGLRRSFKDLQSHMLRVYPTHLVMLFHMAFCLRRSITCNPIIITKQ